MLKRDSILHLLVVLLLSIIVIPVTYATSAESAKVQQATKLYNDALIESDIEQKEYLLGKAYGLNPDDGNISFLYGKTLLMRKKEILAKEVFQRASRDPKFKSRVFNFLADHYFRQKNLISANIYLKKLVEIPEEDNYLNNYRLGEINGKDGLKYYEDSIKFYKRAYELRRFKDNKDILFQIAESYFYIGKYIETISYLKQYPHTNKNNQKAFKLLIKSYEQLEDKKEELAYHLNEYLKIWPYDREVLAVAHNAGIKTIRVGSSDKTAD